MKQRPDGERVADGPGRNADPRWELVQRIAGSPQFARAQRLRELFVYVSERSLRGETELLSEQQIGCAVFGRAADYSPGDDNIVRVQARLLRARLEDYFQTADRDEGWVVDIPKGSYRAVFREKRREPESLEMAVAPKSPTAAVPGVVAPSSWKWGFLGVMLLFVVGGGWLAGSRGQERPAPVTGAPWMLAALFDADRNTSLVIPDSGFGLIQGITGKSLTLDDYLRPGYPANLGTREEVRAIGSRPYATFGDVVVAASASRMAERYRWRLNLRFARDLTMRELDEGNMILLGSSTSNPWVSVHERDLNFQSGFDGERDLGFIRNRNPKPGEQGVYTQAARNGMPGESFATVTLLCDGTGAHGRGTKVLILEGANMEGTEAAWDFVSNAEVSAKARRELAVKDPLPARLQLEILLRTKALAGAARDTQVVTARVK